MNAPYPPRRLLRLASLATALLVAACSTTQRLPGPLDELPAGAVSMTLPPPGATEVTVLRQADGVRVQRPGAPDGYALDSVDPSTTAVAGSIVTTAGPGRAELLWAGSPASVALYGPGALRIGDASAGEGLVRLLYVDRARVLLGPGDHVDLPGGAVLRGSETIPSGPFLVTDSGGGSVELANQSFEPARLAVGALDVEVPGGAIVTIPATAAAGSPGAVRAEGLDRVQAGSLELGVRGDVRWSEADGGVRLEAAGPAEVHGMGLVLRLQAGETATLGPLRPPGDR